MTIRSNFLIGLAAALCLPGPTAAATDLSKGALFASDGTLQVEIAAPWRKLIRSKKEDPWPATITIENPGGEPLTVPLTVERRGISRQRICDFPPIRLRFEDHHVEGTLFDGEGALKLVTHCDRGERWTQYYVLEMLVYRIYNLLTDYSFRVRPMQVLYRDVNRNREPDPEFAFVLEDIDEVADRHDLDELEPRSNRPGDLEVEVASQLALFQFMIGNLDWSPLQGPGGECCHNVKLIGEESGAGPVIPIPYDFDVTGLVDAHYAVPPEALPVRSVRTRLYRGYCAHNETLPAARRQILDLEAEIRSVVQAEPRLQDRSRRQALDYLDSFFEILRSDEEFEDLIVSECRG